MTCDENLQPANPPQNIEYVSYEHDRIVVDSVAVGSPQTVKEKVNAYNKKRLNRLLFVNTPQTPKADACRFDCSKAMNLEQVQFNVDGKQAFMYNGLDTPSRKSAMLKDAYNEDLNCPASQTGIKFIQRDKILSSKTLKTDGDFAYGGCWINAQPEQLEVLYKRTGLKAGEPDTQAFDLTFYGEVSKNLVLNGNNALVAY